VRISRPAVLACTVSFIALAASCGRTGLKSGPPLPPPPECMIDSDCPDYGDLCKPVVCQMVTPDGGTESDPKTAKCVKPPPVDCDDNDPCTTDTCDPATGACSYKPATLDLDGDGHRAPRPGFAPGAPDSCGDDCDDSNKNAFPGNPEVCDGVDNDCNGIVDDNAAYVPLDANAIRIDGDIAPASPGGLAYSGTSYAAAYTGTNNGFNVYLSTIDPGGTVINPPGETVVTLVNADAGGGPLVWVGDRYGLAWEDRRTGDYEVYFTLLDEAGNKKHADTQLTFAQGFSINVSMAWNGTEFLVVWQDDRDGLFNLFGQRVDVDGTPIGSNVQLTTNIGNLGNESPSVAAGLKTVGVAWSLGDAVHHQVLFQTYSVDLTQPVSTVLSITDGTTESVYPSVVWNKDRYVVTWYDKTANPKAVYAAAVAEDGTILVKPTALTNPGPFNSRYPFLRPLGDRLLLVYSDDRDQNDGYEIYTRMITKDLTPLGNELRITNAPKDSVFPVAAFGPEGNVGILFRDDREGGKHHVYFTRLACVAGTGP
jgi:hypothetical protein